MASLGGVSHEDEAGGLYLACVGESLDEGAFTISLLRLMRWRSASGSSGGRMLKPRSSVLRLGSLIVANFDISSFCISRISPFIFFCEFLLFIPNYSIRITTPNTIPHFPTFH